jgi:hypothetical protein
MSAQPDFKEDTIEGVRFRVAKLRPKIARRLFVRLARSLGPALGLALEGAPSLASVKAEAARAGGMGAFVGKVCEGLSAEDIDACFSDLEDVSQYSTEPGKWPFLTEANQDFLFLGRPLLSMRFLAFAIGYQFADFAALLAQPPAGSDPAGGTRPSSPA